MTQPDLTLIAKGRSAGKTTALLDIAMANARRGQLVWFTSPTYQMAEGAFLLATKPPSDIGVEFRRSFTELEIIYPSGGAVRFLWPGSSVLAARGDADPDVRIYDDSSPGADIRFSFSERHRRAQEGIN